MNQFPRPEKRRCRSVASANRSSRSLNVFWISPADIPGPRSLPCCPAWTSLTVSSLVEICFRPAGYRSTSRPTAGRCTCQRVRPDRSDSRIDRPRLVRVRHGSSEHVRGRSASPLSPDNLGRRPECLRRAKTGNGLPAYGRQRVAHVHNLHRREPAERKIEPPIDPAGPEAYERTYSKTSLPQLSS